MANKAITFIVHQLVYKKFRELAHELEISKGEWIRRAIKEKLERDTTNADAQCTDPK